jgi:hypothetical protein
MACCFILLALLVDEFLDSCYRKEGGLPESVLERFKESLFEVVILDPFDYLLYITNDQFL